MYASSNFRVDCTSARVRRATRRPLLGSVGTSAVVSESEEIEDAISLSMSEDVLSTTSAQMPLLMSSEEWEFKCYFVGSVSLCGKAVPVV